jgi:hypothetical protein
MGTLFKKRIYKNFVISKKKAQTFLNELIEIVKNFELSTSYLAPRTL